MNEEDKAMPVANVRESTTSSELGPRLEDAMRKMKEVK